jgi:hypothetical protein
MRLLEVVFGDFKVVARFMLFCLASDEVEAVILDVAAALRFVPRCNGKM